MASSTSTANSDSRKRGHGYTPPASILVIGAGVFGLSTAYSLARRPLFANTAITVLDRSSPGDGDVFTAPDAASVDSSRIIRGDYSDPAYSALACAAQQEWRKTGPGELGEGTYFESGLVLTAGRGVAEMGASGKKTAMGYVEESFRNVRNMEAEKDVVLFGTARELKEATGATGHVGDWGYLNKKSGWADAAGGMRWLYRQVKGTGRVEFMSETVERLLYEDDRVTGAKLAGGKQILAELVILAAGGWTGRLADMRGVCSSTGQALGYVDITEEEENMMKDVPVILNLSTGLFVLPPRNKVLKVARHAFGCFNPVKVPSSLVLPRKPPSSTDPPSESTMAISLPRTKTDDPALELPLEAQLDLREALRSYTRLSSLADRPLAATRLCWYNDTATGDFLVDYHPNWKGLFITTGGSGHGYKFLPVLGDKVVDIISDEGSEDLKAKWRWREGETWEVKEGFGVVVTEDGSRSGRMGMILQEELDRKAEVEG